MGRLRAERTGRSTSHTPALRQYPAEVRKIVINFCRMVVCGGSLCTVAAVCIAVYSHIYSACYCHGFCVGGGEGLR